MGTGRETRRWNRDRLAGRAGAASRGRAVQGQGPGGDAAGGIRDIQAHAQALAAARTDRRRPAQADLRQLAVHLAAGGAHQRTVAPGGERPEGEVVLPLHQRHIAGSPDAGEGLTVARALDKCDAVPAERFIGAERQTGCPHAPAVIAGLGAIDAPGDGGRRIGSSMFCAGASGLTRRTSPDVVTGEADAAREVHPAGSAPACAARGRAVVEEASREGGLHTIMWGIVQGQGTRAARLGGEVGAR